VTTFEPDDAVPEVVRMEAEGSGPSQDQFNGAVRQEPSPSVLDRLSERNRLDEADAMRIALEEITAHREARRNLPLPPGLMVTEDLGKTRSGEPITEELLEKLSAEAEEGFDIEEILRRRGRRTPPDASQASSGSHDS
jgi:hypothetical protein